MVEGISSVPVPDCTSTLANEPSTDYETFENGFASVTPLNPDMTVNFSSLSWFKFLESIDYKK